MRTIGEEREVVTSDSKMDSRSVCPELVARPTVVDAGVRCTDVLYFHYRLVNVAPGFSFSALCSEVQPEHVPRT